MEVTHKVLFDIESGGQRMGTVTIGLFGRHVPQTVNNFATLASQGISGKTYQGSKFHRVIPNFMIQGGDVVRGDGTGSISIFGGKFADESFALKHTEAGLMSMANSGMISEGLFVYFECQDHFLTLFQLQNRQRHEWISVFHYNSSHSMVGWETCDLWKSVGWNGCCEGD